MKELKATLIALIVVLGAIAFVSPVSAYSITDGQVSCDATEDETLWTYDVNCDISDPHAISHWTVAWCSEAAVKEVWVNGVELNKDEDPGWDYGDFDGVHGIKIDYEVDKGETATVKIVLSGCYFTANVQYGIKADGPTFPIQYGTVYGPDHTVIPEFSTIAIPVTAILGLLFFFNRRKRRKA
jgi:hypothetical protein